MATFTFKTILTGSAKYKVDSGPYHIIEETDTIDPTQGESGSIDSLIMITHSGREIIKLVTDTVIVDKTATGGSATTYSPGSNIDTVYDALNPLFNKANTGTSGTGTVGTVPKFTAAYTIGDSHIIDNGTTVKISTDTQLTTNATYYRTTTSGGTSTRSLGLNASNVLFIGSVDATIGDISFNNNGTTLFTLKSTGGITTQATNTAAGTTGAQTINKPSGKVNFAAGASTLVVTNSLVTAASIVRVQVEGTDATATSARVTVGAGAFTITLNQPATAETRVSFMSIN